MNAYLDSNSVATLIGVLNSNGTTISRLKANPGDHSLKVDDNTTGSDNGPNHALKDENGRSTLIAVSSIDGVTPVALYTDASGNLLVDSN